MKDLSAGSIALIVAAGLVLGTFPVYGCPTVLCLLATLVFRVNAPALHLVNQLVSPLQIVMVIPFARLGGRVLPTSGRVSTSILSQVGELTLHAIAGWFCLALPLGILLYLVLWSCFVRRRRRTALHQMEGPAE